MKCEYGCNQEAKHQLKNGKWCCEERANKCIALRKKRSASIKKAHERLGGLFKKGTGNISKEERVEKQSLIEKEEMLCEYGCREKAKYLLKNGKACCEKSANKCPILRKNNSEHLKNAYKEGRKSCLFTNEQRKKSQRTRIEKGLKNAFKLNSQYSSHFLKKLMIEEIGIKKECALCGISKWRDLDLSLELDHINGNHFDNRLENLRLLCPNCHSQTTTFKGKGKNIGKNKVTDLDLKEALQKYKNIRKALFAVKLTPSGGNYKRAYSLLEKIEKEGL